MNISDKDQGIHYVVLVFLALILVGLITSIALADERTVHDFSDVLDKGKKNFVTLCKNVAGDIEKIDETTLACMTPDDSTVYVAAAFENGVAQQWLAVFPFARKAIEYVGIIRNEYGQEDMKRIDAQGCTEWTWVPTNSLLEYMVTSCEKQKMSLIGVGFR